MRKNHRAHLCGSRAKREADADFADAFQCCVSEQTVETYSCESERQRGKDRKEETKQTLRAPAFPNTIAHRPDVERWNR